MFGWLLKVVGKMHLEDLLFLNMLRGKYVVLLIAENPNVLRDLLYVEVNKDECIFSFTMK